MFHESSPVHILSHASLGAVTHSTVKRAKAGCLYSQGEGGSLLQEAIGDVPLDGVAFSRLE